MLCFVNLYCVKHHRKVDQYISIFFLLRINRTNRGNLLKINFWDSEILNFWDLTISRYPLPFLFDSIWLKSSYIIYFFLFLLHLKHSMQRNYKWHLSLKKIFFQFNNLILCPLMVTQFTLHKKWSFPLRISSVDVSWRNLLKKSLMKNFIFCAVLQVHTHHIHTY